RRPARVPAREPAHAHAAPRDRLLDPAPAAVRRHPGDRHADPRMGSRAAGLNAALADPCPPRWRGRVERAWGVGWGAPSRELDHALASYVDGWEEGLAQLDFPEVTDEDRRTFLVHVVSWQVRCALRAGRFELALALRSLGALRVAELEERRLGWRPVLIHG